MDIVKKINVDRITYIWLLLCIFLVISMIFIGGVTRLTGSGLSITKWDPISGSIPPLSISDWEEEFDLYKATPEYKLINISITISEFKSIFLIEYVHRLMGRIFAFVMFLPFIYLILVKKLSIGNIKYFFSIAGLILCQGLMGWLMVKSGLVDKPEVSHFRLGAHLALAIVILSLFLWKVFEFTNINKVSNKILSKIAVINLFLIFFQIILGAFVAGLNGGLIYNTFPLMNEYFVPSEIYQVKQLEQFFYNPAIMQFLHRLGAYIIFCNSLFFLFSAIKLKTLKKTTLIFFLVLILQITLGILTLLWQVPVLYGSIHQLTAVGLYSISLYIFFVTSAQGRI